MDRCYSLIKVAQAVGADIYQVLYSFNFVFIHTIPADALDWGLKWVDQDKTITNLHSEVSFQRRYSVFDEQQANTF